MKKRGKNKSGNKRFGFSRRQKKNTDAASRYSKLKGVETLEPRQMLSVDPVYATADPGNQQALIDRTIDVAFQSASDLGRYTAQQIEDASQWVVKTDGSVDVSPFLGQTSLVVLSAFTPIPNTYFVAAAQNSGQSIIQALSNTPGVQYFYPDEALGVELHSLPDDTHVRDQWHLRSTGQIISRPDQFDQYTVWGADVRAEEAWKITTGEGVIITVVDDGFEYGHEDLAVNYLPSISYDFTDTDPYPLPGSNGPNGLDEIDAHGTAVGGIIGAAGDNGTGVSGVAYDATLGAIRLINTNQQAESFYDALVYQNQIVDIYNNSWGPSAGRIVIGNPIIAQALIDSAFFGRDGLGSIQVFSSGNSAEVGDNANHTTTTANPYTITVSGFGENDRTVSYAEGGPSVFVTAPTGNSPNLKGIFTTDRPGDLGYNLSGVDDDVIGRDYLDNTNYTQNFNGTSASAPAASGVMGLIVAAARDVGIELSMRDMQHILARSSRKISPDELGGIDSGGWQTNTRPIYTDPLDEDGVPIGDAWPTFPGGGIGFSIVSGIPETTDFQHALTRNSGGFFVHDGFDYGYGHGAIDAKAAVDLARNWTSVGDQSDVEILSAGLGTVNIPAAEQVGNVRIPGGVGGQPGFAGYFDLWLNPPEDELPDPLPVNTRGAQSIPIVVPANYSAEWIEVSLNIGITDVDSSRLRLTLVSPDGVHSELTNWERSAIKSPLGFGGQVVHTFTTNRHWGERTEGVGTINPITGERVEPNAIVDGNGVTTAGIWQLVVENWSDSAATLTGSVDFHATPTDTLFNPGGPDLGGRIQGSIGLDINGDDEFNFTGIAEAVETPTDNTGELYVETILDSNYEPMLGGVKVWLDRVGADGERNGVHDPGEEFTYTTSDGNYFFDVKWNADRTPGAAGYDYEVRFEMPTDELGNPLYDVIGDDAQSRIVGIQDDDSIAAYHVDANFVLRPKATVFEGNVFSDFDLDGSQDFNDATVEEFRVFVDLNENGVLDYSDVNSNNVFDNGVDIALEPMSISGPDGAYSLELLAEMDPENNINVTEDFFGNEVFFNDYYVGREYYNIMVDYRDGWQPTGLDITAEGFAGSRGSTPSPGLGFHRVYAEPGRTYADMDFSVAPDLGSISGFVFEDLNQSGTRQAGEGGRDGFTIYLDTDNSIQAMLDGGADPLDVMTYASAEHSIITGDNGSYLFENLPAGEYDIFVTPGPGFEFDDQTHPNLGNHLNRSIVAGQSLGNGLVDFGFFDPDAVAAPPTDYGDLDAPYLTLDASGGASHGIVTGYHLGAGVTEDADGQPDADADADGSDDGVTFLSPIVAGSTVRLDVEASTNVLFLQGWIDFNDDGDFADEGEHLSFRDAGGTLLPFSKQTKLSAGTNELSFVVPDAVMASSLAARFRYGEGGNAQFNKPNGAAVLGEVEDYRIAATVSTSFIEPLVGDYDGSTVVDAGDYQIWKQTFGSELDLRADGNGDGKVNLADYSVWRDNLGAVAQLQQVIAPLSSSLSTEPTLPTALTSPEESLAFFFSPVTTTAEASVVTASNDAASTASVDLAFYELDEQEDNAPTSYFESESAEEENDALLVALEEEFGAVL